MPTVRLSQRQFLSRRKLLSIVLSSGIKQKKRWLLMSDNKKGRAVLRIITEIAALVLIVVLFQNKKMQMWLTVFASVVILSVLAGRFFCGWICPMGTLFRPVGWIYKKLGIKRISTPKFMKKPWIRIVFLLLFVAAMVSTRVLHLKINVLLYLILFSVALTLFFTEDMWHRYLCPFGTILSVSSGLSRRGIGIDENVCTSCGKCLKVCPSKSILMRENKKRFNEANECFMCYKCLEVCPVDAFNYGEIVK